MRLAMSRISTGAARRPVDGLVLSGTGTIVPSGTGFSCYRGPILPIPPFTPEACRPSNVSNQESYGFLLTRALRFSRRVRIVHLDRGAP